MIHKYFASRRLTILLIFLYLLFSLGTVYLSSQFYSNLSPWILAGLTLLIIINLLSCNIKRMSVAISKSKGKIGLDVIKDTGGYWGSIVFHLGMLVLLLGFCINAFGSYKGRVILQEGVPVHWPVEVDFVKKSKYANPELNYLVTLEEYNAEFADKVPTRFYGKISFDNGLNLSLQEVEVNQPARHEGVYWRFAQWGYSVEVLVHKGENEIYSGWINLANEPLYNFADAFGLSDESQWHAEFYPNFTKDSKGEASSYNPEPRKPVLEIFTDKEKKESKYIPLGFSEQVGEYQFQFINYRYWQLMDVSHDPGEYLIYLGSLLIIAGLAGRVFIQEKSRGEKI